MNHARPQPVGGPFLNRVTGTLLVVALVGMALIVWRFLVGLGPSTGLNDGYPWGLWIAFDVVSGTALACGGYAVALLVYVFNRGKYHPLVRPALLTSALGYSVAALAIVVDVGRPWLIWRIPISVGKWNLNSALLEVALCVMAYVIVLWIEMSPAFLEKWADSPRQGLARFSRTVGGGLEKVLPFVIALGLLLPTMHQSSLGTVMLLSGPRLNALWHTPWVPLLFLLSCFGMGYAMVVLESTISSRAFGRKREDTMLASLAGVMSLVLFLYVGIRLVDIILRGRAGLMLGQGLLSVLFWLEIALALGPAVVLLAQRRRIRIGGLFRAAVAIALGGILYRFDAYLVAFQPAPGWHYFPTVPEILITVGIVALEILVFVWLVKTFPILSGTTPVTADHR